MFKKFKSAWKLVKICWRVLMLDKELLIFPFLSFASLALTLVLGVYPLYLAGYLEPILMWFSDESQAASTFAMILVSYLIYVFTTFVYVFFNTALIACARIRFAGGDPTVMDGLRAAISRLPLVFVWAVVTATVGFILQKASEKSEGILAQIVFGLLGAAWTIASYFVVPVLVADRVGPIKAMRASAGLIRKTWGEAIIAELGLSAVTGVVIFPAFLLIVGGMMATETAPVIGFTLVGIAVFAIALTILIVSTLDAILKAALYVYATDGKMPDYFDGVDVKNAFREKESTN